jgi:Bacterial Ig domain/Bacterial cadherin-like domain
VDGSGGNGGANDMRRLSRSRTIDGWSQRGRGRIAAVALGLVLASFLALPAAAQVVIDDFSTNQATLTDPPGGASSVATGGADVLGQHRDLSVLRTAGAGPVTAGVGGGTFDFTVPDTTPDSVGEALLTWDGDSDPNVLDPTGLSGVDLTDGGTAGGVRVVVEQAAAGTHLLLAFYEDADHVSRAGRVLPAIAATTGVFINFSELVAAPGALGPADLTAVGAITLRVGGPEAASPPTLSITLIEAAAPAVAAPKVDRTAGGGPIPPGGVNPGDTLRYRITIANGGGGAGNVDLHDVLDLNETLVGGSLRTTPLARRDQYRTVTDTPIDSAVDLLPSLLANDVDPDGDALVAVATSGQATSQGGTVDVDAAGDFVYTPPSGFQGVDSFTYTLQATAGDPTTDASGNPIGAIGSTAYVTIDRVPPVVTAGGTLNYTENDPPTAIDTTITVTDADSTNLAGATAQITANYALGEDVLSFTNMLGISGTWVPATGTLTLTGTSSVANYQTALRNVKYANTSEAPSTLARTVTWTASDGVETSLPATSTINVTSVNDPPVVSAGGTLAYTENDPATAIDTTITVSDADNANLAGATAQITANYANGQDVLSFANMLGITGVWTPATGTLTLSGSSSVANYQTALRSVAYANTSENPSTASRTVTWIANDGTDPSTPVFSTINVTAVNDPPVAGADSWQTVGNTQLVVDLPALLTPHVRDTTPSTFGVLDNDSDPAEGNALAITAIVGCADATAPFGDSPVCATANGGSVVMEANGRFTYTPPAGNNADDTFQYTVTDDGTPTPASANGTVTIHFLERVWYVRNNAAAGGLGRSNDPFDTLVEAQTASVAGDYIFVHFGAGTTAGQSAGIALKAGQHLIGEHHGLAIPQNLNGNGNPQTLFPAVPGNRPLLDDTVAGAPEGVAATDAIPVEIVGLSLAGNVNAIDLTNAVAIPANATLSIQDNVIRGAGAEGIDVNLNAGTTGTLTLSMTGNSWNTAGTHTGNAVDVNRAAGTLRLNFSNNTNVLSAATAVNVTGVAAANTFITGFANNTVHQATGGSGIVISNATFDANPATTAFDQVAGGTTAVGISGDGVGAAAMSLSSVAGDLAFTDLDLFGAAGLGLSGTGAVNVATGTGTRFTVGAGVATFNATAGPAVSVTNATIDLQLAGMTSAGSATNGVSLMTVLDAVNPVFPAVFSAPSGSSIGSATGTAFNLDGGNATVSYAGTINNTAGRSVAVQNRTADTATFTGAITDSGAGILLNSNNAASTTTFAGGLSLSTGANAAFTATSGGVVNVCDENPCNPGATGLLVNALTTTTATALNVANTTIGANNLEFRSINAGTGASGPTNGIVLNGTGAGVLRVKGDGSTNTCKTGTTTCSGGTIQKATGDGISITSAKVDLALMWIKNCSNSGIKGSSVTGLALTDVLVQNNTNGTGEQAGILINDLTDAGAQVTRAEVSGSTEDNIRVHNTSATGTVTFSSCTVKDNGTASGNDGLFLQTNASGHLTGTVQSSTFSGNRTIALAADSGDGSTLSATFSGNTITAGSPNQGNQGIQVSRASTSTLTFNVDGNTISGMISTLINVFSGSGPGTGTGDVKNNICTGTGVGGNQFGIRVFNSGTSALGQGTLNVNVAGNTVSNIDNAYPIFGESSNSSGSGGSLTIGVTGNTASVVGGGTALDSIRVQARNTSTVCAKVSGNTTNSGGPGFYGIQLRQANTSTFSLEGLTAGPQVEPTVHNFLVTQNPAAATVSSDGTVTGTITGVATNSCGITP